jgi:hypothetical protein
MVDMVLDMAHNTVDMDKMDVGLIGLLPKSLLVIHQQMVQQKILSDHSAGFDIHALALPPLTSSHLNRIVYSISYAITRELGTYLSKEMMNFMVITAILIII